MGDTYKIEVVSRGRDDRVIGQVWWDGQSIKTSGKGIQQILDSRGLVGGTTAEDGLEYLKSLVKHGSTSYLQYRKVNNA